MRRLYSRTPFPPLFRHFRAKRARAFTGFLLPAFGRGEAPQERRHACYSFAEVNPATVERAYNHVAIAR